MQPVQPKKVAAEVFSGELRGGVGREWVGQRRLMLGCAGRVAVDGAGGGEHEALDGACRARGFQQVDGAADVDGDAPGGVGDGRLHRGVAGMVKHIVRAFQDAAAQIRVADVALGDLDMRNGRQRVRAIPRGRTRQAVQHAHLMPGLPNAGRQV